MLRNFVENLQNAIYRFIRGAQCLGISERTFYSKMQSGKLDCEDAKKLADLLGINSPDELVNIFLS